MAGINDVDLYITMHATFNGAYLQHAFQPLLDVPPDPGPHRTNTAVLPVETTLGGTRIRINQNTYLQISTVGDVDLNRVDNHIAIHHAGVQHQPFVIDNQFQETWLRRWRDRMSEQERIMNGAHRENIIPAAHPPQFGQFGILPPFQINHVEMYDPPIIEMRNMNINRRPNEHDRIEDEIEGDHHNHQQHERR